MPELTKPEIIYTHESDLDGFVSGLLLQRLAEKLFGSKPKLYACHNQNWRQRQLNEKAAWVSDMTFEARVDKTGWLVVDHHSTDHAPKYARFIHDLNKSAGLLAYELCKEHGISSPELDRLVHLNNVSDLFLPDEPDFELATDYANLVKIYQFWNLHDLIEGRLENLLDHPLLEVMAVKRRIENPLGFEWSKSRVQELSSNVGYVETVVGNINLIVHQLLDRKATKFNVLLTLFRKGNGTMIVSLRSRNGDAIKVAEKLKGGGHANAAGATLPRSVQNEEDALDYLKKQLAPAPGKPVDTFASLEDAFDNLGA